MKLYTPPTYNGLRGGDRVIFLAGPMQGAPDWQAEAAQLIYERDPSLAIASPRRVSGIEDQENFEKRAQVIWEAHWMSRAAYHGALLFWFAAQDHEVKKDQAEFPRSYAKTTGKELFYWWGQKIVNQNIRLVIGADPEFGELEYERQHNGWDLPEVPIVETLEQLTEIAVAEAEHSRPIQGFGSWTPNNPLYVR